MHIIVRSLITVLLTICGMICTLFISITLYLTYIHWKFGQIPGPPRDSFFLGNLGKIRELFKKGEYTHILFLQWAQEYGPVYRIFVLHKCMVILSGQQVVKEVLTKSKYKKSQMIYSKLFSVCGKRFLGNGLVTSMDHDAWARKRAVINPAFHKKLLKTLMQQFNRVGDEWCEVLEPLADNKTTFNIYDYICRVTLDAIGQVGFNTNFGALENDDSPFPQALWKILEGISAQTRDPLLRLRMSRNQLVQDVKWSVDIIRSEGRKLMKERALQVEEEKQFPDDILTFIGKCAESDPSLNIEDLLDDFCTLLIAGQETTANMIAFLLKEVGRNPHVKQRLLEEIDHVMGTRTSMVYEDIAKLEYMGQVISETLRLYPPAMGTARESTGNTVLEGYTIPPGTQLVVSFYILHRMPQYFKDPDEFRPERFSSDVPRKLFTYMPFSLGQRSCAGKHFAMIEAKVLICKFLRRFDFHLDLAQSFSIQETATLRPKGGTRLTLSIRNP